MASTSSRSSTCNSCLRPRKGTHVGARGLRGGGRGGSSSLRALKSADVLQDGGARDGCLRVS